MALDIGLLNVLVSLGLDGKAGAGLADDIAKAVKPAAEQAEKTLSQSISAGLSKAGKGLTAGVTAPVLAIGTAAIAAGMEVDGALDGIRVGTGATGEEFDQLAEDLEVVAKSSAGSVGRVGEVIADLNTRLNISGEPLQGLAKQIIDLEQISGETANLDTLTRVLGAFGIPVEDAAATFDKLFRASQSTGVPFGALTDKLVSQSAAFAELGFGLDETAALLGQFEKAGVNTDTVLGALRVNIVKAAKEGKDAATFFRDGVKEIEGYIASGDNAAAQAKASELFGARTFLDALDAIKRGQFDIEGTVDQIQNGQDTIGGLAGETGDFAEEFQKLKNNVTFALDPIAQQLFPAISSAIQAVVPFVTKIADAFGELSPGTQKFIVFAAGIAATVGPALLIFAKIVTAVGTISKAFGALNALLVASPWVLIAVAAIAAVVLIVKYWDEIVAFFQAAFGKIAEYATAAWDTLVQTLQDAFATIGEFLGNLITGVLDFFASIGQAIGNFITAVGDAFAAIGEKVGNFITGVGDFFAAVGEKFGNFITGVGDGFTAAGQAVGNFITGVGDVFTSIGQTIGNFITGVKDAIVGVAEAIGSIVQGVADIYARLFTGIIDGFTLAFSIVKDRVKAVYDFFVDVFRRIQDFIRRIVDTIRNLPAALAGGLGSLFSAVIPGFADGGVAVAGKPAIVGERGPELIVPGRTSTVIPNEALGGLGGGVTYQITVNNPTAEPSSTSIPQALRRAAYLRG